jgi:V/A-type H+-transporting ATPase subunit C
VIGRVFKYSFAHAKTRALKGKLLTPEDWHFLLRCRNVQEALQYLSGTKYAAALSHLPQKKSWADVVSLALYDELFRDYAGLLRSVPTKSSLLLQALLSRYEAENVKTILRGIRAGRSSSGIRFFLYHLGRLSRVPVGELLQAEEIESVVDVLKSTNFYVPLIHALPQFKAQVRLFPLEIAIDIAVVERIVAALTSLGGRDRKGAKSLIGEIIDFENLCWLARFRYAYGLSAEEIINYMLPGGIRLAIRDLGVLARSADFSSFLQALPKPYKEALRQVRDWQDIRPFFEQWFLMQLHGVFRRDPFQVSVQAAYLFLKEMEIKTLEGIISVLDRGEPLEKSLGVVSLPILGGIGV